ncbi:hypothetical protein AB0L75_06905 [Streptomyces sp. NPDC052101]|uniref:hypothetical protein n=1 Tax=Streptomyces sp. NPDC052101 TaxID=3155763 RepID=UPI003427BF6B
MWWLFGLIGVVAAAVVLPLAVASAGQVREAARQAMTGRPHDAVGTPGGGGTSGSGRHSGRGHAGKPREKAGSHEDAAGGADAKVPAPGSPRLLGLGLDTATRCGPQLTAPDGLEAQTCVLTQGADTWARTYYRNATGQPLDSMLSLMGPDGRSVQMHCVTNEDDEPATCETPRQRTKGRPDGYTAVDEFATRGIDSALLLRSGSDAAGGDRNSPPTDGS